jgi:DNA helicase II / ATP-dependent DNA helicase PcrA
VAAGKPLWDTLSKSADQSLPPAAAESVARFVKLVEQYRARLNREPLVDVVSSLVSTIKYQDEIVRLYKDPLDQQARWAAVEEVINALGAYESRNKKPPLAGFLDEVALGDRETDEEKEKQLARNAIALMTLHSAKGLEFPQVYLVGMEEGLLPHHRAVELEGSAIDEERRLCYVGITRAQDRLTISLALGRLRWGKLRPSNPSRFLFEITGRADSAHRQPKRASKALANRSGKSAAKPRSATTPNTPRAKGQQRPPRS